MGFSRGAILVAKMPTFCNGKIVKQSAEQPDEFETQIGQTLLDLEINSELKTQLRELSITGAKQIDVADKKCIAIFVPVPLLRSLAKPTRKMKNPPKQNRPRSRTLTSVHDAILEDLVHPAEIVGKRIRVRLDGSRLIKVHLDRNQQTNVEHKIDTYSSVYKKLTGMVVSFEFPDYC